MALESMPPERKTATGTSLTMWSSALWRSSSLRSLSNSLRIVHGDWCVEQIPVALLADSAVGGHAHPAPGRQHADVLNERLSARRRLVRQVAQQPVGVQLTRDAVAGQQRADLGAERKVAAVGTGVVERLDAKSIARQEQFAAAAVPDGEGEHAAQPLEAVCAPARICPQDDLRIGVRAPAVGTQLRADVGEIVISPLNVMWSVLSRLDMGWSPASERSRIARRVCPKTATGALVETTLTPRPSGPRWASAATMRVT